MTETAVTRRTMLGGGAAFLLMGQTRPVKALAPVDQLLVTVLVDGSVSSFAEPVERPDIGVQRSPRGREKVKDRLLAEWGLSLLTQSRVAAERRAVLLDFGYSSEVLLNNADLLGVDFGQVDAMVLSHGHYDHFGGLTGLLSTGRIRRGTPLLIGGEEALCHRLRGGPDSHLDFGAVDRASIARAGVAMRVAANPAKVGHGLTTGRIPLVIEHPQTPTTMEPGKNCDRARLDADKRGLDRVQDDSRHELGLAYHVRDRGLVVFGSCSHRGILNTVAAARAATGIDRVHGIVGGFHLVAPQTRADAVRTAQAMAAIGPDYVIPGHCSGEWFYEAAMAAMPGKVIRPYVGNRVTFGVRA